MNTIKKILPHLKNRFIICTLIFIAWVAFFDRNNFITQIQLHRKLSQLKEDVKYYKDEITKDRRDYYDLTSSNKNLEKFAREKYYMKKANEDIFIFVDENHKPIQ
jgi:cell division protein DivIC